MDSDMMKRIEDATLILLGPNYRPENIIGIEMKMDAVAAVQKQMLSGTEFAEMAQRISARLEEKNKKLWATARCSMIVEACNVRSVATGKKGRRARGILERQQFLVVDKFIAVGAAIHGMKCLKLQAKDVYYLVPENYFTVQMI